MITYRKQHGFSKKSSSLTHSKLGKRYRKKLRKFQYFRNNVQVNILPKVRMKEKLNIDEQILYMKYKGISFHHISEDNAKKILSETNFYYKLSVMRKMFQKGDNNQYRLLSFFMLTDLSSIDMGIRYFLLQMCLDIEHSLKTKLNTELTKNILVNPYLIIKQYKNKNYSFYQKITRRFETTDYLKGMYSKRGDNISFWVFFEILDMGGLLSFLKFYKNKYQTSSFYNSDSIESMLLYTKNIRNCCAHSTPFIYNITDTQTTISSPNSIVVSYAEEMNINREDVKYKKINDLVALFFLHQVLCSDGLSQRRAAEGKRLLERIDRNEIYYSNNNNIKKIKEIFCKLLDYLEK